MSHEKIGIVLALMMSLSSLVFADEIDDLVRQAKSDDFNTKSAAFQTLGQMKDSKAVDALIKMVKESPDDSTREYAVDALGDTGGPLDPRAVDPLIQALKNDTNPTVRFKVARALGWIKDERALGSLVEALNDSDVNVRYSSCDALTNLAGDSKKDPAAIDPLLRLLNDPESRIRHNAALALGAYGDPRAVDPLIQTLKDQDYLVRAFAASALASIKDPKAVEVIRPLIYDPNETVRGYAAEALKELGVSPESSEKAGKPREALDQYLAELAGHKWDGELRKKIIALASKLDPPPAIPEEAKRAMGRGKAAFKTAGNPDEFETSRRELESAVNLAPWWPEAYYNLALVEESQSNFQDALDHLKLYLEAAPQAPDKARIEEKIYEFEYLAEQKKKADEHFTRGDDFDKAKNYAAAEQEYRESLRLDPQNGRAHAVFGEMLADSDRFEEARRELEEALRLGYQNPFLYSWLSYVLRVGFQDYDGAIKVSQEGIGRYPYDPQAAYMYYSLGYSYEAKGNDQKALESFEESLKRGVKEEEKAREKINEIRGRLGG